MLKWVIGMTGLARLLTAVAAFGLAAGSVAAAGPAAAAQAAPAGVRPWLIRTVAGGPGGPAAGTSVAVDEPCGVTATGQSVDVSDRSDGLVRRLDVSNGVLSTAFGAGPAGAVPVSCSFVFDHAGNLISVSGDVLHVIAARNGVFYGVKMQAGHTYEINVVVHNVDYLAQAVAIDQHGNLLVSTGNDFGGFPTSSLLWVLAGSKGTFYGQAMKPGRFYPLAGKNCSGSKSCDPGFGGDGGPALDAILGQYVLALAVDAHGNVLIADAGNNRIRVVAAATGRFYGRAMTAGYIYTIAGGGSGGLGDGGPATSAVLNTPEGLAVDRAGDVAIADTQDHRVRLVAESGGDRYGQHLTAGDIYSIAGNGKSAYSGIGGPAGRAALRSPGGLAFDSSGNLLIADQDDNRVLALPARTAGFYGRKLTSGHLYAVAGNGLVSYSGAGSLATSAQIRPEQNTWSNLVAVGQGGSVVLADSGNYRVRVVPPVTGLYYGRRMTAGHIYTIAGTGAAGFSGDGGLGVKARLYIVAAVAADKYGNVLISDGVRVRVIAARTGKFYGKHMTAGYIYTIAGGGNEPADGVPALRASLGPGGLAVDSNGNVVLSSNDTNLAVVAEKTGTFYGQKMTAGYIYTLSESAVGGVIFVPNAIAFDHAGNIVIGQGFGNVAVLAVKAGKFYGIAMRPGRLYSVAGSPEGIGGFSGDGGPATKALLGDGDMVAVDGTGNLVIADGSNNRIRVVAERSGTFYGVKMTAGDIYTVAGGGAYSPSWKGFAGDGGAAVKAELSSPEGVAVDGHGLLVYDAGNSRVRLVSAGAS
ncbi:MAG TPA: hypothetical protein VMA95_05665 [Streptosporangiaceae bacterium]|nr:hypothetical protein [Streptosporangiaceae bacterium]